MSEKYFAVIGSTFVVPLTEIGPDVMKRLLGSSSSLAAVPVYFCPGVGVWPHPASDCIVVKQIDKMIV